MAEIVILEGLRYKGIFKGDIKSDEVWGGGCSYGEYKYIVKWWEGTGIIDSLGEGHRHVFNFSTSSYDPGRLIPDHLRSGLYWHILKFERDREAESISRYGEKIKYKEYDVIPNIVRPKELMDIYLESLVQKIEKIGKDKIPRICFDSMNIADLVQRGIVAEQDGQVRLSFG